MRYQRTFCVVLGSARELADLSIELLFFRCCVRDAEVRRASRECASQRRDIEDTCEAMCELPRTVLRQLDRDLCLHGSRCDPTTPTSKTGFAA